MGVLTGLPMVPGGLVRCSALRQQTSTLGRRPKIKAVPKGEAAKQSETSVHRNLPKNNEILFNKYVPAGSSPFF
jgi:hypothetical protein